MDKNKRQRGKNDHLIEGGIMLGIGIVFMLILVGAFGKAGSAVANFLVGVFGYAVYAYFLLLIIFGVLKLFKVKMPKVGAMRLLSLIAFFAMIIALLHCVSSAPLVGNGYGKYLEDCYLLHNTAGGVLAGVVMYPLLLVSYLGIVICGIVALAMCALFAFYDTIFAKNKTIVQEPVGMVDFSHHEEDGAFEIVGNTTLMVENAEDNEPNDKKKRRASSLNQEYVPLEQSSVESFEFGSFLNNNDKDKSHEQATSEQQPEEQSRFDEAYNILYGNNSTAKPKEEEEQPKPREVLDSSEYQSYTNDYRRDQIMQGMSDARSSRNDTDGNDYFSIENITIDRAETPQNHTQTDSISERRLNRDKTSAANSNLQSNITQREKADSLVDSRQNDDLKDKEKESSYDEFVRKANENNIANLSEITRAPEPQRSVTFEPITPIEEESREDVVEDKTAKHREIEGFEHLLRHQKEERERRESEVVTRRHNLTENIQAENDDEEDISVQRERRRKERSDKGGSHNSSKQNDFAGSSNSNQDGATSENVNVARQQPSRDVVVERVLQDETPQKEEEKKEKQRVKLAPYKYPPIELLKSYDSKPVANENFDDKIEILETTLSEFGIDAKVNRVVTGPTFTRLELVMPKGIPVKRVLGYVDDIAMCLEVKSVRCQIPIPGKNAFGVEIPNSTRGKVGLKSVVESQAFVNSKSKIAFAVGQDCEGENYVADLAAMPHLLIAGATGAGKSVCLNSLIVSLLYKYTPEELKLLLVDPKQVELNMYNRIPHMLIPEAVSEKEKALNMLDWAIEEMEMRYTLFKDRRVQKITDYNATIDPKKEDKLPYIVIIIDEVGDFMLVIKKELEERIRRLTQKARAAGIHLILATQRPSVDVITGVIKANLPARIAFAVTNFIDSKTILDQGGAEKLLRYGDMIFTDGVQDPTRLQGTLIEGDEVNAICDYVRANNEAYFDKDIEEFICNTNTNSGANAAQTTFGEGGASSGEQDELFVRALYHVVTTGAVSISKLQRKFGIGFPRAARIVDTMEELGYIGPSKDNNKQKDILIDMPTFLAKYGDVELQ